MWPDDSGSWDLGDAYAVANTPQTVTTDVATANQAVNPTGQDSGWSGFLQKALGQVVTVGLQAQAAKSSQELALQRQQALTTLPLVSTAGSGLAVNTNGLLLIGGIVLVIVLVANGGKG